MTAEVESIQGLLWKYKRGTVTNSWKRNWVYADNEHFFQWAGKNRPQRDEVPKYELFIPNCNLTRSELKKFSFSIQLQPGGEAMVFATDDQHSFQKWWKLLHKHCSRASSSSSAADDTHSDDNTLNTEEQKNLALNVLRRNRRKSQGDNTSIGTFSETASQEEEQVMQLFRKISKRNKQGCRYASLQDMRNVLSEFDNRVDVSRVLHLLKEYDTNFKEDTKITKEEFRRLWREHEVFICPLEAEEITALQRMQHQHTYQNSSFNSQRYRDWSLLLCGTEQHVQPHLSSLMLRVHVPMKIHTMESLLPNSKTSASTTGNFYSQLHRLQDRLENISSNFGKKTPSHVEEENEKQVWSEEVISTAFEIAQMYAQFHQHAMKGAKLLIDEYSLPNAMKTLQPVMLHEDTMIFEYEGVHLRVLPANAVEEDMDWTNDRERVNIHKDDIQSKMASNQLRGAQYVNDGLDDFITEQKMCDKYLDITMETDVVLAYSQLVKVRRRVMSIVDYAGFRILAYIPHNNATKKLPWAFTVPDGKYAAEEQEFVRALENRLYVAPLEAVVNKQQWNSDREEYAASHDLSPTKPSATAANNEILLDGFLQSNMFLPADLPRPKSHDILMKHVRPEFLKKYQLLFPDEQMLPLSSEALLKLREHEEALANHKQTGSEEDKSSVHEDEVENRVQEALLTSCSGWMKMQHYYYETYLADFVRALDLFTYVPYDSFSLTNLLHSQGINVRHVGILYGLSKNIVVKQLLISEVLARSVKYYYQHVQRALARQCKAMSISAEHRNRSKVSDYLELNEDFQQQRQQLLLNMFNFIFPSDEWKLKASSYHHLQKHADEDSEEAKEYQVFQKAKQHFFANLAAILHHKFGLNATSSSSEYEGEQLLDNFPLHAPQLLLALQYHLQVKFKEEKLQDNLYYGHVGVKRAFTTLDVVDFFLPACSMSSSGVRSGGVDGYVGEFKAVLSMRDAFMSLGYYQEATAITHFQYVVMTKILATSSQYSTLSWQQIQSITSLTYEYILMLFLNEQYDEAAQVLYAYLNNPFLSQYSPANARILVLMIAVEYQRGHYERALQSYDSAFELLSYFLPPGQPLIIMPMIVLADLYTSYSSNRGIENAKIMLELANTTWRQNHVSTSRSALILANSPHSVETYLHCLLQCKLVAVNMELQAYHRAVTLLLPCVRYLEELLASPKSTTGSENMIRRDLIRVYYQLAWAYYHASEEDDDDSFHPNQQAIPKTGGAKSIVRNRIEEEYDQQAIQFACKCLSFLKQHRAAYQFHDPAQEGFEFDRLDDGRDEDEAADDLHLEHDKDIIHMLLSLHLILYDMYSTRNEYDLALESLTFCWNLLKAAYTLYSKSASSSQALIVILAQIAIKKVELTFTSLPMYSRVMLENVSKDWLNDVAMVEEEVKMNKRKASLRLNENEEEEEEEHEDILLAKNMWHVACMQVLDILWKGQVVLYINELISEIHKVVEEHDQPTLALRSSSNKPADGTDSKPALNPPAVPSTVREEVRKGIASLPIHVQAAAVYMIVDQPLDFAKQFHDVYMAKKKKDEAARQAAKRSEVDDVSRSMIEEPY